MNPSRFHSNHRHGNQRPIAPSASEALLDEDRIASMADEGGVSGALMEIDDLDERRRLQPGVPGRRWRLRWSWGVAFGLMGLALLGWAGARRWA